MKTHQSTTPQNEKDLAQTPLWLVQSVELLLGIHFALDVCAQPETAKAGHFYALEHGQDGLRLHWMDVAWCNPPFSAPLPWIERAASQAAFGNRTAMILPDNPETQYVRVATEAADTLIRMPFRLQFERPDGTPFLDRHGRPQSPQFPCLIAWFTPLGLKAPTRQIYHDFRGTPQWAKN